MSTLLVRTTADPFKMVIIYGQPVEYNYVLMKSFIFSNCVSYCYEMTTCEAVYSLADSDTCIVFEFGQISSLKKFDGTSGKMMGVKMLSANNSDCSESADGNSMKSGYRVNSTAYQPYTITSSNSHWRFTSGAIQTCQNNFSLFVRPLGPWCIGNDSTTACKSTYGGVLSGLQTLEERDFVVAVGTPLISLQSTYNTFGFWVNGKRKELCKETTISAKCNGTNEFDFTDPLLTAFDGYTWAGQQPSGVSYVPSTSDCLNLYFRTNVILGIDDYRCWTPHVDSICYKGYVCGQRPS